MLPTQNNTSVDGTADTGYDLYAVDFIVIPATEARQVEGQNILKTTVGSAVVPVGLEIAYIEPGYWLRIEGRSGLGFKKGIQPHFGIIDNQYRGDLGVKLYNLTGSPYVVEPGDKIAQLVAYKLIEMDIEETDSKEETARGEKGFGSSGK